MMRSPDSPPEAFPGRVNNVTKMFSLMPAFSQLHEKLHEPRRHELAARVGAARQMPRTQMAFRHGESGFQSQPFKAEALAQARPVGISGRTFATTSSHIPHQRRHLTSGAERRGITTGRAKGMAASATFSRTPFRAAMTRAPRMEPHMVVQSFTTQKSSPPPTHRFAKKFHRVCGRRTRTFDRCVARRTAALADRAQRGKFTSGSDFRSRRNACRPLHRRKKDDWPAKKPAASVLQNATGW